MCNFLMNVIFSRASGSFTGGGGMSIEEGRTSW